MNEIFIIGKVASKVEYKFIVNNKKQYAKAEFEIEKNKEVFKVVAYNNIADYCYRKLKTNTQVFIYGKIETGMRINIKSMEIIFRTFSKINI